MTPLAVEDSYPLSPLQQGMLSHTLYAPRSGVEIFQIYAVLREPLDVDAFRAAWQASIDRHPMLRTAFRWDGLDRPEQIVYGGVRLPCEVQDWRELPTDEQEVRFESYLREDRRRGIPLARPPLLRIALFRCDEEEHRFVLTFHHAILDGRSVPQLLRESFDGYESLRQGREPELPAPAPFRAFIERLEQRDAGAAETFWRQRLAGFSAPTPLPGKPTPRAAMGDCGYDEVDAQLSPEVTQALIEMGEREGFTLNTALQAAWALVLSRWSGEQDVVFATVKRCRFGVPGSESIVGPLINTLPVRAQVAPETGLLAWLRELRASWTALREHEHTSLSSVQEWSDVPAGRPLCESLLIFERYYWLPAMRSWGPEWESRSFFLRRQPDFPLTAYGFQGSGLLLKLIFDRQRFSQHFILRLLGYLRSALEGMAAEPHQRVGEIELISAAGRWQILGEWNDTAALHEGSGCLHELVEEQALRTPDAIALVCEEETLTYRELDERSRRLAHYLRRRGVGPEVPVGVCLERSAGMVVSLLAVLKAGGAFLPLDPTYPLERLSQMIEDSRAPVVLTERRLAGSLPAGSPALFLEEMAGALAAEPATAPLSGAGPDNIAYVIYTSGSTGRPKGVMNTHRGIRNRLLWAQDVDPIGADDVVLQKTPFSFDISVWELFWPLIAGARLIVARPEGHKDSGYLVRAIVEHGVTTLHFVSSMLRIFLDDPGVGRCSSLRRVLASGEALPAELAQRFSERLGAELYNLYGPTEAAVEVTAWTWRPEEQRHSVPIGRPIANVALYALDGDLRPVPMEGQGELYLGGVALARGYLGRPDLTAERFVPDPFGGEPGARLYRTGDRVRHGTGGEVEYLGRLDHQVKIRGFRIEPGEVEAVLRQHPAVADAAVVVREDDPGEPQLAAYVVPAAENRPAAGDLSTYLEGKLPRYMIPAALVLLDVLPLTPNGKLDVRVLPRPERRRTECEGTYLPPGTALEKTIARIWQEVLHVERVGLNDNFFDLGGHSLSVARVFQLLSAELGRDLSQVELFEFPTVSALARRLTRDHAEEEMEMAPIEDRVEAQRAALERRARPRREALHE